MVSEDKEAGAGACYNELMDQVSNENGREVLRYSIALWQELCGVKDIDAFIAKFKAIKDRDERDAALDSAYGDLVKRVRTMKVQESNKKRSERDPNKDRDASPNTKRNVLAGFRRLLFANNLEISRPTIKRHKIELWTVHDNTSGEKALDPKNIQGLLNPMALKPKAAMMLAMTSGMRKEDLRTLKWKMIDFTLKPIEITLDPKHTKGHKPRKTFTTQRVGLLLKELRKYYVQQGAPNGDDDYVFLGNRGMKEKGWRQFTPNGLYQIMRYNFDRNGNKRDAEDTRHELFPHLLRGWAKTSMIRAGIPIPFVEKIIGHRGYLEGYILTQGREEYLKFEKWFEREAFGVGVDEELEDRVRLLEGFLGQIDEAKDNNLIFWDRDEKGRRILRFEPMTAGFKKTVDDAAQARERQIMEEIEAKREAERRGRTRQAQKA